MSPEETIRIICGVLLVFFVVSYLILAQSSSEKIEHNRLLKKLKQHTYPEILIEWLTFIHENKENFINSEFYTDIEESLEHVSASQYASTVFYDPKFVDAFAKLTVIFKSEKLKDIFLSEYEAIRSNAGGNQDVMVKVITPIQDTMKAYFEHYEEYKRLEKSTNKNELNLLLNQDFSKIYPVKKVESIEKDRYNVDFLI